MQAPVDLNQPAPVIDRRSEWFVPQFGPLRFRIAIGLLFLPYTGMVLSYTVIGAMLAPTVYWDRVVAMAVIYFLGLGIAAHALDAIGANGGTKPWGTHFSQKALWILALVAIVIAYGIGGYYIVTVVPGLCVIALLEGFFLFAYNLEWFHGRFHTNGWFAFSWGVLPVWAGYVMQTNRLSLPALFFSGAMGGVSLIEIHTSRRYKEIKKSGVTDPTRYKQDELILKSVSLLTVLLAVGMILWRR